MLFFQAVSFDQVIVAFLATVALREAMLTTLPPSVVGPHGWLLRTEDQD